MRCLLPVGLIIACKAIIHAHAFAPIQWGALSARRFVLAPDAWLNRAFVPNRAAVSPLTLRIWDQNGKMPSNELLYFTAKPDKSITLDALGLCIDGSNKLGDEVHVTRCTGEATQKWNWLPNAHGGDMIQLKDTDACLDVSDESGLDGAPITLGKCENKRTESWIFHQPNPLPSRTSSHFAAPSNSGQQAVMSFVLLCALGVVSLSTWLWRRHSKRLVMVSNLSSAMPDGGIALYAGANYMSDFKNAHMDVMVPAAMALTPLQPTDGDELQDAAAPPLAMSHQRAGLPPIPLRSTASRHQIAVRMAQGFEEFEVEETTELRILEYPHPLLRAPNEEITVFDYKLEELCKELFLCMYAYDGVGLAAPQVGINQRLIVYNPNGFSYPPKERRLNEVVLCNPKIVEYSSGKELDIEGCLSFPGFTADVARNTWIQVEYQNLQGKLKKKTIQGVLARFFQHELDHLDGTLYVDRLAVEERIRIQPNLNELVDAYKGSEAAAL